MAESAGGRSVWVGEERGRPGVGAGQHAVGARRAFGCYGCLLWGWTDWRDWCIMEFMGMTRLDWLSVREVASRLGVSDETVRKYIRAGYFADVRRKSPVVGSPFLISAASVAEYEVLRARLDGV